MIMSMIIDMMNKFEYIPLMYAVDLPPKIEKLLKKREIWVHVHDHILEFWESEAEDKPFIKWLKSYGLKSGENGIYRIALMGS